MVAFDGHGGIVGVVLNHGQRAQCVLIPAGLGLQFGQVEQRGRRQAPQCQSSFEEAECVEMARRLDQGPAGHDQRVDRLCRRRFVVGKIGGGPVEVTGALLGRGHHTGGPAVQLPAKVVGECLVGDFAQERIDRVITTVGTVSQETDVDQ